MSNDSAIATQMVGIVTLSRLLRGASNQSLIGYSNNPAALTQKAHLLKFNIDRYSRAA